MGLMLVESQSQERAARPPEVDGLLSFPTSKGVHAAFLF